MTTQEQILKALKGCSAQSPLAFGELVKKTGIPVEPLLEALQDLFDARAINRCTVTRENRTQVVVWPTGVPAKIAFGQFTINPNKAVSAEHKPAAAAKNSTQEQEQSIMEPTKTKVQIMLDLLVKKGSATTSELVAAANTTSVKPFLGGYIARGLLTVEEGKEGKTYAIAPGVEPGELFERTKPVQQPKPEIAPIPAPVHVMPEISALTARINNAAKVTEQPAPTPVCAEIRTEISARPRFRLARTSDQTIMLFGLVPDPIELDLEQTQLLVNFATACGAAVAQG